MKPQVAPVARPAPPPPSPFRAASGIYLLVVAILLQLVLYWNDGAFSYMLDDAYIHLAMAKHCAERGVWGITPYDFSASSSSPAYTALLAAMFRVFGTFDLLPFLFNLALCLLVIREYARRMPPLFASRPAAATATLSFIALAIPLPMLLFNGLEHVLHILLALRFVDRTRAALAGEAGWRAEFYALGAALPMVRYESLFLILPAALLLALRGLRRDAALLLAAAATPVLLVGAWQVAHGDLLLPNSVIIKGRRPPPGFTLEWLYYLDVALKGAAKSSHLLTVLIATLFLHLATGSSGRGGGGRPDALLFLAAVATAFQLTLADHGHFIQHKLFMRYDAWISALGLLALLEHSGALLGPGNPAFASPPGRRVAAAIAALVLLPFLVRGYYCLALAPVGCRNVHDMHHPLGRFIDAAYPGERIAVHDIGAVNHLADFRCVDIYGLGHRGFRDLILARALTTETMLDLCRRESTEFAVIWRENHAFEVCPVPKEWIPVAEWRIDGNVIMPDDRWTFFAAGRSAEALLRRNLDAYSRFLPSRCHQTFIPRRRD